MEFYETFRNCHYNVGIMAKTPTKKTVVRSISDAPIHARLLQIRKERGLSQAEVAESLELTQALVSSYEKGSRRLHAELIAKFATYYEVSADDLLGLKHRRNPTTTNEPTEIGLHLIKRLHKIQSLPKLRQKEVIRTLDLVLNGIGRQ